MRRLHAFGAVVGWVTCSLVTAPLASCRATPAASDAAADAGPRFVGRFDRSGPSGVRFAWPGSTIVLRFRGTGLTVRLKDEGTNFFAVVVDGGDPTVVPTGAASETYTLARGLRPGVHEISITKRTETLVGTVELRGFLVEDGALMPAPPPSPRRIEFIGDSITCGFGLEGPSAECPFTPATEDEYDAYGARAARLLGAEHVAIAWSGKGVVRNYGGGGGGASDDTMPLLWERTLGDRPDSRWDFAAQVPQVVVIHLGTNDFSTGADPAGAFEDGYAALIGRVRGHYPLAFIVCAIGPMLEGERLAQARARIAAAVAATRARGEARVSMLEFSPATTEEGSGCAYHPSRATQARMAEQLVAEIRRLTGWR